MSTPRHEKALTLSQAIVLTALIKELRERARHGGAASGLTVEELSKILGSSKSRIRAVLAELKKEGLAVSRLKPFEFGLGAPGRKFREKIWTIPFDPLDDEQIRMIIREREVDRILGERGIDVWKLLGIQP